MNKTEFNSLEVLEQIEYINKSLLEGNTLTNICKSIGIGRSTIRDRFKKVSYEYNKSINQYESIVEIIEAETIAPAGANKPIKEDVKPFVQESSNLVVGTELYKNNEILINMINNYDDNLSKLNELYDWYKLQSSNKVVEAKTKMDIPDYNDDVVVRSYKLYVSTHKRFTEFCKANNKYKVQDILCYLLEKGMDAHE